MLPLSVSLLMAFGAALVSTFLLTAAAKPVSRALGILDYPDPRKMHRRAIPYLGGAAMFLGLLAGIFAFSLLAPDQILLNRSELFGVVVGGLIICMMGLWDDVRGATAWPKLLVEIAVAAFMWHQGFRVDRLTLPFSGTFILDPSQLPDAGWGRALLGQSISLVITIGWFLLLMNAINLIDGLDGLAAGIGMAGALVVVLITLAVYESEKPPPEVLLIGLLTAGICLGFLWHNWHPATIFMGDCGALLIGFLLAAIALRGSTKTPTLLTLLIPLVAVGLPIVESVYSFARRVWNRQHPFRADRRHLHHRLLNLGLSHRQVVLTLLYATAFLGLLSFLLAKAKDSPMTIMVTVVLLGSGFVILIENLANLEKNHHGAEKHPPSSD